MKRVVFALSVFALAGCASPPGSQADLTQYGTPPSDQDLYQYMSSLRDSLPPTRYVSYRDQGYDGSIRKVTLTDQDGKSMSAWEYDFDLATYDSVDAMPPTQWRGYRTIFFNGRPIGMLAPDGAFVRGGRPTPTTSPPAAGSPQTR